MGKNEQKNVAHTPDEIKELLRPLHIRLKREAEDERLLYIAEKAENYIEMALQEEQPVRKQCMRSQSKRRKKLADAPHIAKLHKALMTGTSGKKEDIERTLQQVAKFDKKYKPDTHHDFTMKKTLKNIMGMEKISHKFNFSSSEKKRLVYAFKIIAQDLEANHLIDEETCHKNHAQEHGHELETEKYKHIPRKIRGDHLLERYEEKEKEKDLTPS